MSLRIVRWGLAAAVGLLVVTNSSSPAQALFAPAAIHKVLFHFDEGSGTTTVDAKSGTTNAAVFGATWTSGRYGSALLFDGVNDTVTFPHSANLNWTATDDYVVIEAWIKPTGPGTIVAKGVEAATTTGSGKKKVVSGGHNYRFGIDESGNLVFSYTDTSGTLRQAKSPLGSGQGAAVSFHEWHWVSVAFSHNYEYVRFIVDGGLNDAALAALDKKPGAPDPLTNMVALSIGSFGGPPYFKGTIDEVRISVTPDGWPGGSPQVMSNRGVVISRVEFNPATGKQFIELYRADFGDGAPPVSLSGARLFDNAVNEYYVPSTGAGCETGDTTCYLVSPGETVRIYLNGAGPAKDTASITSSQWFTSNNACSNCTLGDGGQGQDLGLVDFIRLYANGLPKDPDSVWTLGNADIVVWGGNQSTNSFLLPTVSPEGLWPAANAFVATTGATEICLISPGNNLAGPAAWKSSCP